MGTMLESFVTIVILAPLLLPVASSTASTCCNTAS
jgi:TRAP-type C4-dicarboxylate transport system permease large subunit